MKYIFTVEVETDNIIGTKEQIASALEDIGKVTFPLVQTGKGMSKDGDKQQAKRRKV